MNILAGGALSTAIVGALAFAHSTGTPTQSQAMREAAVYAALIEKTITPRSDTILLVDSTVAFTVPAGGFQRLQPQFDSLPDGLPARLAEVSRAIRPTSSLTFAQPVRTILRAQLALILGRNGPGWDEFLKQYPNQRQYLEVSPIAFTSDGTSAMVYYRHLCGRRCGGGSAVWLQIGRDGKWLVRKVISLFAS